MARLKKLKKRLLIFAAMLLTAGGATVYFLLMRLGLLMSPTALPAVLCLPVCPTEGSLHSLPQNEALLKEKRSLAEMLGTNPEVDKVSILIEKSQYKLTVFYDRQPIKSYPVVLGGNPRGDKRYEGDRKTPEGIFRVRDLYPHPSWSKFIWLDYPTSQSWRKHFQAKFAGEIDGARSIGSEIGIHGVPIGTDSLIDEGSNWTLGCISLKNNAVNELYDVLKVGSLVEIVP